MKATATPSETSNQPGTRSIRATTKGTTVSDQADALAPAAGQAAGEAEVERGANQTTPETKNGESKKKDKKEKDSKKKDKERKILLAFPNEDRPKEAVKMRKGAKKARKAFFAPFALIQ